MWDKKTWTLLYSKLHDIQWFQEKNKSFKSNSENRWIFVETPLKNQQSMGIFGTRKMTQTGHGLGTLELSLSMAGGSASGESAGDFWDHDVKHWKLILEMVQIILEMVDVSIFSDRFLSDC